MSKNTQPENAMPENTPPVDTLTYSAGLGNYDRVQHAREEAVWAPLSPKERRQWTQALLDFRPSRETVMTYRMLDDMVNRTGVISLERLVQPLRDFDAAGFSAQDWLEIMTSLHVVLARQPERVIDNPAVTMLPDFVHSSRVAITPEAWLAWLPLRRKGASALSATHAVLQAARPDMARSPRSPLSPQNPLRPETQA
jgi:hypothetical protein